MFKPVLVVSLLILISAAIVSSFQTAQVPSAMPWINEAGWKLFVDQESGYSFSYPSDAQIDYRCSQIYPYCAITLLFRLSNAYGYHGMEIVVNTNFRGYTPEEFVRALYPSNAPAPDDYLSSAERMTVAGIPAIKVEIPPTLTDFVVVFPYHDKMFAIYPTDNPMVIDDPAKDAQLALFYKILGTFRFITNEVTP